MSHPSRATQTMQKYEGFHANYPLFDIADKYNNSAKIIYEIVMMTLEVGNDSYSLHFFAGLVAEYAATEYVNCTQCGLQFGLIEKDWEYVNRTVALFNDQHDIVYYLCYELKSEDVDDDNFDYVHCDKVLCFGCGLKWRCGVCDFQAFSWNHDDELIPGGCYYCNQNICDYCAVYVESRQVGICDECYEDDAICDVDVDHDGIIIDILN